MYKSDKSSKFSGTTKSIKDATFSCLSIYIRAISLKHLFASYKFYMTFEIFLIATSVYLGYLVSSASTTDP